MQTTAVRFWSKVAQTGNVCECWDWTARLNAYGYGVATFDGRQQGAHRVAWQISRGAIQKEGA